MPTPTGTISLSDVNDELGNNSTAQISMNYSAVRDLAERTGTVSISMNNLRGKSAAQDPWYLWLQIQNEWRGGFTIERMRTANGANLNPIITGAIFNPEGPGWDDFPIYPGTSAASRKHMSIGAPQTRYQPNAMYFINDGSSYVEYRFDDFDWSPMNNTSTSTNKDYSLPDITFLAETQWTKTGLSLTNTGATGSGNNRYRYGRITWNGSYQHAGGSHLATVAGDDYTDVNGAKLVVKMYNSD